MAPNLVNTPVLVKEFGLNVAEQVSPESHKDFDNLVTVEFTTKGGATQKISATLVGNVPKIVAVNDFAVDVCPQGDMLLFTNTDRPGVLKVCAFVFACQSPGSVVCDGSLPVCATARDKLVVPLGDQHCIPVLEP